MDYVYAILLQHKTDTRTYLCQMKGNDLFEVWSDAQKLAAEHGYATKTMPKDWLLLSVIRNEI